MHNAQGEKTIRFFCIKKKHFKNEPERKKANVVYSLAARSIKSKSWGPKTH
jgi:hypothetical protein